MIIVKITALSIIVTVIYAWAIRVWASGNPIDVLAAQLTRKYPKWMYFILIPIFVDVVGVVASAIWFLFVYL